MDGYPKTSLPMYFNTTFRNVGLYISLSFAGLAYSRAFRGKDNMYDILLIFISMAFVIIAAILNYSLYMEVADSFEKNKKHELVNVLYISFGIILILLILNIITALRSLSKI